MSARAKRAWVPPMSPTTIRISGGSAWAGARTWARLSRARRAALPWWAPVAPSPVLASLDQRVDQAGIGEPGGVAERAEVVFGDLAQDAPHDLARTGLGQGRGEVEQVGAGDRPDLGADLVAQLVRQRLAFRLPLHQGDVGVDALALDLVRAADHRRLGDRRMGDERALERGGAEPVAGYVEHVVDAPGDPVIAVLVAAAAIAGEISAPVGAEIGLGEALVIAVDGTHLPRPGAGDAQVARAGAGDRAAVAVDQLRHDAEEGLAGRARLHVVRAGQGGDH